MEQVQYRLHYNSIPPKEAPLKRTERELHPVWERYALPLGNGYLGACVFGYPDTERIQITENSLANPYRSGWHKLGDKPPYTGAGLNSFAELYVDFGHREVTEYERELNISDAIARVKYVSDGVKYAREYFTSYPDKVLAMRFTSEGGKLSFFLHPEIPHLTDLSLSRDGFAKLGGIACDENGITLAGEMEYYGIKYEGRLELSLSGGICTVKDNRIAVDDADEAVLIFACATNYRLESRVFTEPDPKKKLSPYPHPHNEVADRIERAIRKGYTSLLADHLRDYHTLFDRVSIAIGDYDTRPTDLLLSEYQSGGSSRYLEMLLYQYGRYLLISSSREGCLPANLQGVWCAHNISPWSAGYWHNINLQMNYWPAEVANLKETFIPYADYNKAYMAAARENADRAVMNNYPLKYTSPGTNGWIIGTGGWPYRIEGFDRIGHSGPGTGAITALLFWEYYDFTRDIYFLRDTGYPVLREMALFLSKTLIESDGLLLVHPSASPEVEVDGKYYHTTGCSFDQQMVYETYKRTLESAEILGISDSFTEKLKKELPRLSPIEIGADGQIKEFREEVHYADIGEREHRHISHLLCMYPGTLINKDTPEWLRAAEVTLTLRGDRSHTWATAHRQCLWARARRGNRAMDLIKSLIRNVIMQNLWGNHPPFQIDGNFGLTAGISEMLLQSHAGYIDLLPALPDEWQTGSFRGLVARGGFEVDCNWRCARITAVSIRSTVGGILSIDLSGYKVIRITKNGVSTNLECRGEIYTLDTERGDTVEISVE